MVQIPEKGRVFLRRLASFCLRGPVLTFCGLVLFSFLLSWLAAGPLLKWGAPRYLAAKSGHRLSLAEARFYPFSLSIEIKGLALAEPDGKSLLAIEKIFIDLDSIGLFKRAWTLDALQITAPRLAFVIRADGSHNWAALLAAFKKEEEPGKLLPRLLLRQVRIDRGRVDFADHKVSGGFATIFYPLDLSLAAISTLPNDRGSYLLSALTPSGTRIRWKGDLGLNPLASKGALAVDGFRLARLWPYLSSSLRIAPPEGVATLACAYQARFVGKKPSLSLDHLALGVNGLALTGPSGSGPSIRLNRIALADGSFDLEKRQILLGSLAVEGGRLELGRKNDGRLDLLDWLPPKDDKPQAKKSDRPAAPWQLGINEFSLAGIGLGFRDAASSAPFAFGAGSLAFHAGLEARLGTETELSAKDLQLNLQSIRLDTVRVGTPVQSKIDRLSLVSALSLQSGSSGLAMTLDDLGLDLAGIGVRAGTGKSELGLEMDGLRLAGGISLAAGGSLLAEGLNLGLEKIRLRAASTPLASLGAIRLDDGLVDLADRQVTAKNLSLSDGRFSLQGLADGRIVEIESLRDAMAQFNKAGKQASTASAAKPWHYGLDRIALGGFSLSLADASVAPAASLHLDQIEASLDGFAANKKQAMPVRLAMRVREGGRFNLAGTVNPAGPDCDLKLELADLALIPAQPYLSRFAHLKLSSGQVSTEGRVRVASRGGGPRQLGFRGGFTLRDLRLAESETGEPLLGWQRLVGSKVHVTPAALRIGDLKLDGLETKLVVERDKSVNLNKVLKRQTSSAAAAEKQPEEPVASVGGEAVVVPEAEVVSELAAAGKAPYRIDIDRLRFEEGKVDFADLSLAFPFAAKVHGLKGLVSNIANIPGGIADLELEGRVDQFGLARATGRVDLFRPTDFMDIRALFRNVEMKNLSPYTATFAGYHVESGRLSLDLEYKIKKRQLLGENKIIMDQLVLGERVERPGLKNLPLRLAVAILKDADGKINLGLPVAGSLDDPKFSYGGLIWKAFVNVLTKVVTSPFRALGALVGGSGEKLAQIVFEAGRLDLTPPEKEKFGQIAKILEKRPALALVVKGGWSASIDRTALEEAALRRAVAEKIGIKLAPGEDPGPVSTTERRSRRALEKLYAERLGDAQWKTLNAKWRQANPDHQEASRFDRLKGKLAEVLEKKHTFTEEELNLLRGIDLYQLLYLQLLPTEKVADTALVELARQRAVVVMTGLTAAGVPAGRCRQEEPIQVEGEGREVPVKLDLVAVAGKS